MSYRMDTVEITCKNGVTFTPKITPEGVLFWGNDGGLKNPKPFMIKGKDGGSIIEDIITLPDNEYFINGKCVVQKGLNIIKLVIEFDDVKSILSNYKILTLDTKYRPTREIVLPCLVVGGTVNVKVSPNGDVAVLNTESIHPGRVSINLRYIKEEVI